MLTNRVLSHLFGEFRVARVDEQVIHCMEYSNLMMRTELNGWKFVKNRDRVWKKPTELSEGDLFKGKKGKLE